MPRKSRFDARSLEDAVANVMPNGAVLVKGNPKDLNLLRRREGSMWARTNIGASVVPQYLQRGGSAFLGAFFSDIETNEKPIPIRRQAVPDIPRRHIQKRMKFRFELTNT